MAQTPQAPSRAAGRYEQPESWDEGLVSGLTAGREEFPPLCSLLIAAARRWCEGCCRCRLPGEVVALEENGFIRFIASRPPGRLRWASALAEREMEGGEGAQGGDVA